MTSDLHIASTAAPTFLGRAIRWFSRGDVSHSLAIYRSLDQVSNRWNVLQALADGFHEESVDREKALTWVRAWRFVGDDQVGWKVVGELRRLRGVNYDYGSILAWAWAGLKNRCARADRFHPRGKTGRVYCSEAVSIALGNAGVPGFGGQVTPAELDRLLAQSAMFEAVNLEEFRERIDCEES